MKQEQVRQQQAAQISKQNTKSSTPNMFMPPRMSQPKVYHSLGQTVWVIPYGPYGMGHSTALVFEIVF